jgi:ABC-type glycerol-3-phosphate transport system substrate-binding protein
MSAARHARRRVGLVVACLLLAPAGCTLRSRPAVLAIALLPSELPAYCAVLADFEAETGARVRVVPQQYAQIRRALEAEAAGGGGALDLVELDVHSLAAAAPFAARLDAGALRSVVDALEPAALEAGTMDGLRFLPHRVGWQALLYDRERVPQPPATWEELLAVARAHSGRIGLKAARYEGLTCDVLPFVWAAGGSGADLREPAALAAFRFLAQLAPHLHPQSAMFREATIAEAMARGELVLHLNWPFAMRLYADQELAPERIAAAPLPRGPAGRATVLGGGYLGIPVHAPHPELALALLRHLLSAPVQERLARELSWFSARRDVAVAAGDLLLAGWRASRADARARPETPDYLALSRAWQRAFRAMAFEGVEPEAALTRFALAGAPERD